MRTFEFRKIEKSSPDIEDIFRLRYQVYCNEWGFEDPADYPDGLERDVYDQHSVHFGAYLSGSEEIVGTTRIILNSQLGFPMEKNFTLAEKLPPVSDDKVGEISRFAVSKDFMRRATDQALINGNVDMEAANLEIEKERRRINNDMIAGLYKCIWNESQELGLTHWYAGMARSLYLILKRWGIVFHQIGPEADYHGLRGPYLGKISETGESLARRNPDLLKFFEQEKWSFASVSRESTAKIIRVAG